MRRFPTYGSLFHRAVEVTQTSLEGRMDDIVVAVGTGGIHFVTGEHHSIVRARGAPRRVSTFSFFYLLTSSTFLLLPSLVANPTNTPHQVESYAFDRVQKWMVSRESGVFAFAVDGADELLTVQSDDAGEIERAVQKCVAAVLDIVISITE